MRGWNPNPIPGFILGCGHVSNMWSRHPSNVNSHIEVENRQTTRTTATNDMNEPKKSDPTTQVIHEQATATNASYTQPSQPMVIIIIAHTRRL
jgi:hypothetical protein